MEFRRVLFRSMAGIVEKKLVEIGITLPTPAAPIATYVGYVRTGSLLFVSGQLCLADGQLVATGQLGVSVSIEDGQTAVDVQAAFVVTK